MSNFVPTHIQVTVLRARGLRVKGKHGTSNPYAIMGIGKEQFKTTVQEKTLDPVWQEECELLIPKQGNTATVSVGVYHHTSRPGFDDFLGEVLLPLCEYDVYDPPRNRWYKLKGHDGKDDGKERGEIEIKIAFTTQPLGASLTSLNKRKSSSVQKVAHSIGGSLMSLGSKEKKNFKKFASNVGHKLGDKVGSPFKKHRRQGSDASSQGTSVASNADPGVASDSDDEWNDGAITPRSTHSASSSGFYPLGFATPPTGGSREHLHEDLLIKAVYTPPSKPPRKVLEQVEEEEQNRSVPVTASSVLETKLRERFSNPFERSTNNPFEDDDTTLKAFEVPSSENTVGTPRVSSARRNRIPSVTVTEVKKDERDVDVGSPREKSLSVDNSGLMKRIKTSPGELHMEPPLVSEKSVFPIVVEEDSSEKEKEKSKKKMVRPESMMNLSSNTEDDKSGKTKGKGERLKKKLLKDHLKGEQKRQEKEGEFSVPAVASVKPIVPVRNYEPNVISPSSRSRHPLDVQQRFANLNRDDLMEKILELEREVKKKDDAVRDLQEYLDNLLVHVMEKMPTLLQISYSSSSLKSF
ncbi:unnamed protein product [Darwinula stevensoni]|uniref:Uncharacterized protein n=1 Tax=Darwinula stevensoni TaxID=69355 RepID=A0A7R8XC88_9CRUS|nr:unnamed protein product [Darwinula stevensoni]CAG0885622.1 unnamed protein product [Darwinula stevensoni]